MRKKYVVEYIKMSDTATAIVEATFFNVRNGFAIFSDDVNFTNLVAAFDNIVCVKEVK